MKFFTLFLLAAVTTVAAATSTVVLDWTDAEALQVRPLKTKIGTPIFLRELYSLRRPEDFLIARHLGFNAVIETDTVTFRRAEQVGFHVTEASWYGRGTAAQLAIAEGEANRDEPLLISYNLSDEPDLRLHQCSPAALQRVADFIRQVDPSARFSVTLAGRGRAREAWPDYARVVDIMRVDPYPLVAGTPLRLVSDMVTAAHSAAGPDKPVVTVLQAWDWPGAPFPDRLQIRQMAWQSLIAGSNGISYFDWNFELWARHPEFYRAIIDTNHTIAGIEPLLVTGRKFPALEQQDVYASVWQHDALGWMALVTRLGETRDTVDVRLRFPVGLGHHEQSFRLPPMTSILLRDPIPVDDSIGSTTPRRSDLAGRPWQAIHDEVSLRLSPLPGVDSPFDRAGRVVDIFPGSVFRERLHVHHGRMKNLEINTVSWHDTETELTGAALAAIVQVRIQNLPRQRSHGRTRLRTESVFLINVHLPAGQPWRMHRDHLLTFDITWTNRAGVNRHETRVIRYRLHEPFDFDWQWTDPNTGIFRATPLFNEHNYPLPFKEQKIRVTAPAGITTTKRAAGDHAWRINFSCSEQTGEDPADVRFAVIANDTVLASVVPTNLRCADGRIRAPGFSETAKILRAPQLVTLDRFDQLTRETTHGISHFLAPGQQQYSKEDAIAWLFYDDAHLYWLMRNRSPSAIRAETQSDDTSYLADDTVVLLIRGGDDSVYRLATNAAGKLQHARVAPDQDISWSPEVRCETRIDGRTWYSVMSIPWQSLGWQTTPPGGSELRLNLVAGRSIAPRVLSMWHPMTQPFEPDESLGPAVISK